MSDENKTVKEMDLLWRFNDKHPVGKIKILVDKVNDLFKLGYTFGLAPGLKIKKKDGEIQSIELYEISLIPIKNVVSAAEILNETVKELDRL